MYNTYIGIHTLTISDRYVQVYRFVILPLCRHIADLVFTTTVYGNYMRTSQGDSALSTNRDKADEFSENRVATRRAVLFLHAGRSQSSH